MISYRTMANWTFLPTLKQNLFSNFYHKCLFTECLPNISKTGESSVYIVIISRRLFLRKASSYNISSSDLFYQLETLYMYEHLVVWREQWFNYILTEFVWSEIEQNKDSLLTDKDRSKQHEIFPLISFGRWLFEVFL